MTQEQIDGIILLDKDEGQSSAQAIARLKKRLSLKKIGHAGTLDPFATGLLVVLVNGATRLARYAEAGRKVYSGVFELGVDTDSHDRTGNVTGRSNQIPSYESLVDLIERYRGELNQVPPQISALKVQGQRAYRLARQGAAVQLEPRKVTVDSFAVRARTSRLYEFRLTCSKGTYVRSLVRDIGAHFGCGACLTELRREQSVPFSICQAKKLLDLTGQDVMDWRQLFPQLPYMELDASEVRRLLRGEQAVLRELLGHGSLPGVPSPVIYVERESQKALGLLEWSTSTLSYGVNVCQRW